MKTLITTLLLTVGLAWTASAQTTASVPAAAGETFTKMDADGDGSISRAEFDKYAAAHAEKQRADFEKQFAELDANKDGKVDKDESGANAALEAYFDQIDENGDGSLTKEEIGAAMQAAHEANAG